MKEIMGQKKVGEMRKGQLTLSERAYRDWCAANKDGIYDPDSFQSGWKCGYKEKKLLERRKKRKTERRCKEIMATGRILR